MLSTAGLPDQGFEDSDNSSIFSSLSPKSRQRINAPYSAEVAPVRQRIAAAGGEETPSSVPGVQRQTSHGPASKNVLSTAAVARPLSLILSYPDETCAADMVDSSSGQVVQCFLPLHDLACSGIVVMIEPFQCVVILLLVIDPVSICWHELHQDMPGQWQVLHWP